MSEDSAPKGVSTTFFAIGVTVAALAGFYLGTVFATLYETAGPTQSMTASQEPAPAPPQQTSSPDQNQLLQLEQQVAERPGDAEAWTQLGHGYFDANMPEKAIQAYEQSLALAPGDAHVLTDLGVMYRRAGQPKKSIEVFRKAIKLDPEHEISRFNAGIVLMHDLEDPAGAVAVWEELLELDPNASSPSGTPVRVLVDELRKNMENSS